MRYKIRMPVVKALKVSGTEVMLLQCTEDMSTAGAIYCNGTVYKLYVFGTYRTAQKPA